MKILNKRKLESEVKSLLEQNNYDSLEVTPFEPFFGDLIWDQEAYANSINNYINLKQGCYLIFLIDLINTLNNFLLSIDEIYEKNYYSWSNIYGYDPGSLFIVNATNHNGYIYFDLGGFCLENNNGYAGQKPNSIYLKDVHLAIQGIKEKQTEINNYENCKKNISYIKETPQSLLQKFLPCFIENIYDIPKDSILWETPLLKETMANYEALKKYAEERGWL